MDAGRYTYVIIMNRKLNVLGCDASALTNAPNRLQNAGALQYERKTVLAWSVRSNTGHHAGRADLLQRGDKISSISSSVVRWLRIAARITVFVCRRERRGRGRGDAPILQIDDDLPCQVVGT